MGGDKVVDEEFNNGNESCSLTRQTGCHNGVVIPAWQPSFDIDVGTRCYRAFVYMIALFYLMFGVNILNDRLLSTIEVIVSKKRIKKVKTRNGTVKELKVPIWHPIVASLTVETLGMSAAECLLPTIEVFKQNFSSDELGPSLVVGSGAYHMLLLTGICMLSVKNGISKKITDLPLFFVTSAFGIFAFLWLFLVAEQISPGVIELWEAIVTLGFFPIIVFTCWTVQRRFPWKMLKFVKRNLRQKANNGNQSRGPPPDIVTMADFSNSNMILNERRRRLGDILRQLKQKYPNKPKAELEEMAEMKLLDAAPKGAAYYRMQTSKSSSGGGAVISKEKVKKRIVSFEMSFKSAIFYCLCFISPSPRKR